MARGWHILREGGRLTLTRHLPARFDVMAEAAFPRAGRLLLAHQVRQDMWRALRDLRGFSPVVEVDMSEHGLICRAGGRVKAPAPLAQIEAQIAALLASPGHRARWLSHAGGMG